VEGSAELLVFLTHCRPLAGKVVKSGGDGHYAGDCSAEDIEDGALASRDGLEGMGPEVLN